MLDRLLFRCDNNATRNYLIGAIEYCLLSSSTMQHLNNDDAKDKDRDDAKDIESGLITNTLFLNSLLSALLDSYKCIKKLPWIRNNDVLLVVLLRVLALFLSGVL